MNRSGVVALVASFFAGILLAVVSFGVTGALATASAEAISGSSRGGFLAEIAWLANYLVVFFFAGFMVNRSYKDFKIKSSVIFTFPIFVPTVLLLFMLASFANEQDFEVLPRILWVISPIVGYYGGIRAAGPLSEHLNSRS